MAIAAPPRPGQLIPPFDLPSVTGGRRRAWDYRDRRNLVLAFGGRTGSPDLLGDLARYVAAVRDAEGELVAIVPWDLESAARLRDDLRLPYEVLADPEALAHARFGALDERGQPAPALYVADRNGEIYARSLPGRGEPMLTPAEAVDWLEFIELQTPECESCVPAWPRD